MTNFFSILLLAIGLSADTFSMCLGLGTTPTSQREKIKLSLAVGFMHFLMPLLGEFLGQNLIAFLSLNSNKFLGGILLFISLNLLIDMIKKKEIEEFEFSIFNIILFSFGVSIDAFSTGLGLGGVTNNKFLATTTFSLVSFIFTYLGLYLGSIAYKFLEKKASIFGFLLLTMIGVYHLCK